MLFRNWSGMAPVLQSVTEIYVLRAVHGSSLLCKGVRRNQWVVWLPCYYEFPVPGWPWDGVFTVRGTHRLDCPELCTAQPVFQPLLQEWRILNEFPFAGDIFSVRFYGVTQKLVRIVPPSGFCHWLMLFLFKVKEVMSVFFCFLNIYQQVNSLLIW